MKRCSLTRYLAPAQGLVLGSFLVLNNLFWPACLWVTWWTVGWWNAERPWWQNRLVPWLYRAWVAGNRWCLHATGTTWQVELPTMDPTAWTLVIGNHVSWADIPVLLSQLQDHLPHMKFVMKDSLKWLPILGWACKHLGYVLVRRPNRATLRRHPERKHLEQTKLVQACESFARSRPTTLVIFPEGGRFTPERHRLRKVTRYQHCLPPISRGLVLALTTLEAHHPNLQVLDVTLQYLSNDGGPPSFWRLLCGQVTSVSVHVASLPRDDRPPLAAEDRAYHTWLNARWDLKDQRLNTHHQPTLEGTGSNA